MSQRCHYPKSTTPWDDFIEFFFQKGLRFRFNSLYQSHKTIESIDKYINIHMKSATKSNLQKILIKPVFYKTKVISSGRLTFGGEKVEFSELDYGSNL